MTQGKVVSLRLVRPSEISGGIKSKGGEITMAVIKKDQRVIACNLLAEEGKQERECQGQKGKPRALYCAEAPEAFPGKIGDHRSGKPDAGVEDHVEDVREKAAKHREHTQEHDQSHDDVIIAADH